MHITPNSWYEEKKKVAVTVDVKPEEEKIEEVKEPEPLPEFEV